MELVDWLDKKKQDIVRDWIRAAMSAYPTEAVNVFNRNKDQFANPLPHIISKNIELLFDELLKGIDVQKTSPILSEIVRLKAVQDFKPSEALQFIFDLKEILYNLKEEIVEGEAMPYQQIRTMETEIDRLANLAFDIYVSCREKLSEIRVNEIKNQTHMLIRRVNEMDKPKEAR